MSQLDLERMSNKEIAELWKRTTAEARKQRGFQLAQAQAQNDLGITDEEYYIDGFGNRIEGKRPTPKTAGHYVGPDGYVVELKPGERPPDLSGNGIVDWLNNQDISSDPELREVLGAENLFFDEQIRIGNDDVLLKGRLESDGWHVVSRSGNPEARDLRFRLGRSLTREQAIEQAVGYVESKSGPRFRELTDNERRMCERMAVTDRVSAFVFYIQARLPEYLADEFLQLGAAGDELAIQRFGADEKISEIAEEACAHTFYWHNPKATEEFFDYARSYDGGRVWTFPLLDTLWNQYQVESSVEKLDAQPAPTQEDLDSMSDQEIEKLLLDTRKLRAGR